MNCLSAKTLFVKSGERGNGTNWADAIGDLQDALKLAIYGDEVWVAKGTYFPTACKTCNQYERAKSFNIPNGVKIYGGFAGNETSTAGRKVKDNPTQLSGNIGQDDFFDNSFTVVSFENVDQSTLLDGFIITGGMSDNKEAGDGERHRSGGAIFNLSSEDKGSSPVIVDCLVFENLAAEGGGIFNNSKKGSATILAKKCTFLKNKAVNAGGAIMDFGTESTINSTFSNCKFILNEAKFGGAFYSNQKSSQKEIFENCSFVSNTSDFGAAGFISSDSKSENVYGQNCSFKNNVSKTGSAVFIKEAKHQELLKESTKPKSISL